MFSSHVDVRTSDAHSIIDATTGKRINFAEDVEIGEHVWLGLNCQILKGARIGDHSVIATGAIVSGSIPANSIAAGIPARPIRSGISWRRDLIAPDTAEENLSPSSNMPDPVVGQAGMSEE